MNEHLAPSCKGAKLLDAEECPAGAIPLNNPKLTDKDKCISCMHCVAVCPKKARITASLSALSPDGK